jgi:hypothetical protein
LFAVPRPKGGTVAGGGGTQDGREFPSEYKGFTNPFKLPCNRPILISFAVAPRGRAFPSVL